VHHYDNFVLCVLQKLQLAQGLEAEKERRMTLDHYVSQVGSTWQPKLLGKLLCSERQQE
jgi:hypothetical protein